jgi:muramoyltetrapeptide carboxypeptidase
MVQSAPCHVKPTQLRQGDFVAVVSPSFGAAGLFPHRLELGFSQMKKLGFQVKVMANARGTLGAVSGTPQQRVDDLHTAFLDPQIKAVIAAIGGDHSNQLLPLLDFDLIRANPKIFMGYSDITVLNLAIHRKTGLVTFNGPAFITDFGEYPAMLEYTRVSFQRTLCSVDAPGQIHPAADWTEEFLDWGAKKDLERPRLFQPSPGWSWIKPGSAEGWLVGGCIESMDHLRGTPYWPDFEGAILFLETSEDKPSPQRVNSLLMDYQNMGVFDQINGLLVGRPMLYSDAEKQQLRDVILERARAYSFPIITDMDFGHTAPQMVLPIGCRARVDGSAKIFEIIESAVTPPLD